jgi:hypothetical protein
MANELRIMPEIYANAYVTISASGANSCHDGFLAARSIDRRNTGGYHKLHEDDIILNYERHGVLGSAYFAASGTSVTVREPIEARAWTLQERELSPRILDYGSCHLRWICNSRCCYDGGRADEDYGMSSSIHSLLEKHARSSSAASPTLAFIFDWCDVVEEYSRRILSDPDDKLVAFSAIAQSVGARVNLRYIAGLWEHHVAAQLLWHSRNGPRKRPEKYRAPSWSWASVDGRISSVQVRFSASSDPVLEVLRVDVESRDPNFDHGAVVSARMMVKGPLMAATWWPYDMDLRLQNMHLMFRGQSHDGDYAPNMPNIESPLHGVAPSDIDNKKSDVHLMQDAIETDWPDASTGNEKFAINVYCLFVIKMHGSPDDQKGRYEGLLLVAESLDDSAFRRVGTFGVVFDSEDVLDNVGCREVVIY